MCRRCSGDDESAVGRVDDRTRGAIGRSCGLEAVVETGSEGSEKFEARATGID